jgi:Mrp family chromosome partitioning ATPase
VSGKVDAVTAVRPTPVPNLMALGNSRPALDAGGVASSEAMQRVITELEKESDIVVIDTTPVLGPSDALSLAPFVDAVLLVAHTELSTLSRIEECSVELRSVDSMILGVVLTGVTSKTFHAYGDRTIYYAVGEPNPNGGRDGDRDGVGGPAGPDAAERIRMPEPP